LESLALGDICKNKYLAFTKTDKASATVTMDKRYYLADGYRQLNNNHHKKSLISSNISKGCRNIKWIKKIRRYHG